MPSLQQSMCAPSVGADLTRLNEFLDFLSGKLAASDYAEAVDLLWAATDPVAGARRARGEPAP
jgi:hypothetical protein